MSRNDRNLRASIYSNSIEEVTKFISGEWIDPETTLQEGFISACYFGRLEIIQLFLFFVPHLDLYGGFVHACSKGHIEIVKLLLADQRLITDSELHRGLDRAACDGQVEVVRLLLADGRFDPLADNNVTLWRALYYGTHRPSFISEKMANDCLKCAELLLADERLHVSPVPLHGSLLPLFEAAVHDSRIRAYLLLKRSFRQYVLSYKSGKKQEDEKVASRKAELVTQIVQDPLINEVLSIEKQILSCLDVYLISDLEYSLC
jgi:hypothetical protein